MFGFGQRLARQQATCERAEHLGFGGIDDVEHREIVMALVADTVIVRASQHRADMREAEALAGAIDGGEQLLRQRRRVGRCRGGQAIVAIAARHWRVFTEMAEQDGAATGGGFDQRGKRIQPCPVPGAAVFRDFLQPLARLGEIGGAPEQMRFGRIAITPRPPRLLIIGLDRFGQAGMDDEAHIGFVDTHAKGDGGDHHHILRLDEGGLIGSACLGR